MLGQSSPQTPGWFLNFLTQITLFMLNGSVPEAHLKLEGEFSKKSLVGALQIWNNRCLTTYSQYGDTRALRAIYIDSITGQPVERKTWDILSYVFARMSNSSIPDKPIIELNLQNPPYTIRLDNGVPSTHFRPKLPIHALGGEERAHIHFWVNADGENAFNAWKYLLEKVLATPTKFIKVSPDGRNVELPGVDALLTKTDAQKVIDVLNATYTENNLHQILPAASKRISLVANEALQTFGNNIASALIGQIISCGAMYGLSYCQDRIALCFKYSIVTYVGLFIKLLFFAIFASSDIFIELLEPTVLSLLSH